MNYQNGASKYKQTSIESASKEKIMLMIYEAAIRNVKLAKKALEEKRIADKGAYLGKAHSIVSELMNSLDHRVGGKISQDLEALYIFIINQITKGNIENNASYFDTATKLLETLHAAWVEAVDAVKKDRGAKKTITIKT